MIPKLIIRKQRVEDMGKVTAKMNLLAKKTVKILIWCCLPLSSPLTVHIHQAPDKYEGPQFIMPPELRKGTSRF